MAKAEQPALFEMNDLQPQGSSTSSGEQVLIEQDSNIVPAIERLRILQLDDGFSPSTRGELNEAFNLKAFIEMRGGTARHLAEVAIHQGKYGADAVKATSSLTRSYVLYAGGARTDRTMLETLREELQEMTESNPLSSLNRNAVNTGLGQLVRYKDLRELGETQDFTKFPFSPLRPYAKNLPRTYDPYVQVDPLPDIRARIDDVLAHTRVWEARREVESAITEQRNRQAFWTDRIAEIEQYQTGVVRTIAGQALERLGVKPTLA